MSIVGFRGAPKTVAAALWAILFLIVVAPQAARAQCTGKPSVWMNERTAASHLLSSRKFVLPAIVPVLAHIRNVVVTVTVDRKGSICRTKAEAGPGELRAPAEKIVRTSWRYRPFLLDRKPVVVQFPVTVYFVISADRRDTRNIEMAHTGEWPKHPGASLRFDTRKATP